jgi:hypothetical protein
MYAPSGRSGGHRRTGDSLRHLNLAVLSTILLVVFVFPAFSLGTTEESDYRDVDGMENWTYEIDTAELAAGTYNVLLRATDNTGNEVLSRPNDIIIDPASDIPVVSVSTPEPDQVVGRRLMVLGTADDDDAVATVQVQLDDGPIRTAEGTDYWSVAYDLADVDDGTLTLQVRAVDTNGIESELATRTIVLDTSGPDITISNPGPGETVGGRIEIAGDVADPNGLVAVRMRVEGETESFPFETTVRRRQASGDFAFRLDTRDMPDGPLVIWVQAEDVNGSITDQPLLLFVDNEAPVLRIDQVGEDGLLSADAAYPGDFVLSGHVSDTSGIGSFTYQMRGEEPKPIEIAPGDPFWALDLTPADSGSSTRVDFFLEDTAGNTTSRRVDVPLDPDSDLPVVEILPTENPLFIAGRGHDDDGVALIEYRHGGADEWQRLESDGAFTINLAQLAPYSGAAGGAGVPAGITPVELRATDINGLIGPSVEIERVVPPSSPALTIPELVAVSGEERLVKPLVHGKVLIGRQQATVQGAVDPGSRPGELRQVRYRVGGGEWSTTRLAPSDDGSGLLNYAFALNSREPAGIYPVEVEVAAAEAEGIETAATVVDRFSTWYYRLDQLPEEPDPEVTYLTEIPDPPELRLADGRMEDPIGSEGSLRFRNDRPLVAVVPGAEIISAAVDPPDPGLEVRVVDGAAMVVPRSDVDIQGVALTAVTADGKEWRSSPLDVTFDETAPSVALEFPVDGDRLMAIGELAVLATDSLTTPDVSIQINGGRSEPLSRGDDGVFRLPMEARPGEGVAVIEVFAADGLGNTSGAVATVILDETAPSVELLAPRRDDPVNGSITLAFALRDDSPITEVWWQPAGEESAVAVDPAGLVTVPILLQERDPTTPPAVMIVTDRAGNTTVEPVELNVDPESDRPVVAVQLPVEDSIHREDFAVSGTVLDDDGAAEVWYRIDDGDPVSIGEGTSFTFPVRIADLGDNSHTIAVFARDRGGVESTVVERTVRISLEPPTGSVVFPGIELRNRGALVITGTAADANGIAAVEVSLDNGASFGTASPSADDTVGWSEWTFDLDSTVLRDGLHAIQYRITDSLGTPALSSHLITIDNTPPNLAFTDPVEREILGPEVTISGRVLDEGGLDTVEYRFAPLHSDTATAPDEGATGEGATEEAVAEEGASTAPVEAFGNWMSVELLPGGVIRETVPAPVSGGAWNIALRARDAAGNLATVSRNVRTTEGLLDDADLSVLSPVDGEQWVGRLVVSGVVPEFGAYDIVAVTVDGGAPRELRPDASGAFWMQLDQDSLPVGRHDIEIRARSSIGAPELVQSRSVEQLRYGPWVRLESHANGQLLGARPIISGFAGYFFPAIEGLEPGSRDYRDAVAPYAIDRVEVSLDNGKTFANARGGEEWEYRIETADLPDGILPVVLRVRAADGTSSVLRSVFRLDTQPPRISVDQPRDGARFNDPVFVSGTAEDESGLQRVQLVLREGSKNRYEVPEFIQGLYVDVHMLGATQWDIGAGLTFFDDNVKLQGQIGRAPSGRFSGTVLGGKLLANVASLPLSYVLGPDWDFVSGALAIGANFSYFSMEDDPRTDRGLILGGIVSQLEFPIINRRSRMFNAFSFYTELQFWFISSDVQGGTETKLSFGLRSQLL